MACGTHIGCFRAGDERVEERAEDGTWRTAFSFTGEERRRMHRRGDTGDATFPGFVSLAVVDRPDGEHLVVAMGSQGVLHRSPDGSWERRSVLDRHPLSTAGPSWLQWSLVVPIAIGAVSPLFFVWGRRQRGTLGGYRAGAVAAGGAVAVLAISVTLEFSDVDYLVVDPLVVALSLAVFVASVIVVRRPPVAQRS